VVVLEHGAHLGDAPAAGAQASASGVGVGEAVDAPPGVLGLVVGLAAGRAWDDADAGVVVQPAPEFVDDEVLAVVLAGDLGAKVAAEESVNFTPSTWSLTQATCSSSCAQREVVFLRAE